jgi:predicted hydrocarbon binding protein
MVENNGLQNSELSKQPLKSDHKEPDKSNKGGRPRHAPDTGIWSVRGVDRETRMIIEKASQRAGKTIGQYINEDVRSYTQQQLKEGSQVPIRQEDIRTELDDIKGMIAQLAERIPTATEKKGFFKRLFN